ncbi:MAG: DUF983 domain-containing protein [Sphingomonas sp.]
MTGQRAEGADAAPPPVKGAIEGLCPRCGGTTLFKGPVAFADRCLHCGLDFTQFNVGDGPAAFLTLILGALIVTLAVVLQLAVDPPLWVQALIWIPVATAGVVGSLRVAKAALIGAEYRNAAREGKIAERLP